MGAHKYTWIPQYPRVPA